MRGRWREPMRTPIGSRSAMNEVDLDAIHNVSAFEELARQRMDPGGFAYYSGGAWDEVTLRDNVAAFRRRRLLPRVLTGVAEPDTTTTLLGREVTLPIGLAPASQHGLAHPEGEVATAAAAARAGVVMCLSTWSNRSIEDVGAQPSGPRWLQLYLLEDRGLTADLVARAVAADFDALVLTVDLPVPGYRERELAVRFSPPQSFGNFPAAPGPDDTMMEMVGAVHAQGLTWDDLAWIASLSRLPVAVKGVLAPQDALLAVDNGAAAVWVSNHGGRQLDRSPAAIDALPAVVDAVAGRAEVYVDGGVRRGIDVATALALGARAAFIGRPYLYALAAAGAAGVSRCLELLRAELVTAMVLLGVGELGELGPQHVL